MNRKLIGLSLTAALVLAACGMGQVPKDTIKPAIALTTQNDQTIGVNKVTLQGKVTDNGKLKTFTYALNGGAAQTITLSKDGGFTVEVAGLVAGENTVVLTAIDEGGNEQKFTFKVTYNPSLNDKTAPVITVSTQNDQTIATGAVTVQGKATDDVKLKALTYTLNGGAAQNVTVGADGSFSLPLTNLQPGLNTVVLLATDEAGNPKEYTFKVTYDANGTGSVKVSGQVASNTSGAFVPDSTVKVEGMPDIKVRTDATGSFTLDLDPGTYTLDFVKDGYAASRIEGLIVTSTGPVVPLNVVQKVSVHGLVNKAPMVTSVQTLKGADLLDVTPGMTFDADSGVSLNVTVAAADESLSPSNVYVNVGNTPGSGFFGPRKVFSPDPKFTQYETGLFTMKGADYNGIRGKTVLNIVAYDFNGNRIQKLIPIEVVSAPNNNPLGQGPEVSAVAYTFATKFNFFSPPTQNGTSDELSNLFVELNWKYNSAATGTPLGFRIWKSYDNQTFNLIRTVAGTVSSIRDGEPSLMPGKKTYYYVEAFNSTTSSNGKIASTTPLDVFRISTLSPENHSVNASVQPNLSWTVDKLVGDVRYFYPSIWDYPDQNSACYWGEALCTGNTDYMYKDDGSTPGLKKNNNTYMVKFNENGLAYNDRLQAFHTYTFALSAAAFSKDMTAVSIAQDWSNIFHGVGQCNFGGPVCEGKLVKFTTGDGSF